MGTKIKFSTEARESLKRGVDQVANAVKESLGAEGRNVIIPAPNGGYMITKDGVSIARSIYPEDGFEAIGASLIKEAATRTNGEAGDGPQPLYSKVATPNGFVKIEDLEIGDVICGVNEDYQTVTGIFEKGEKEIYQVIFSDGRVVECSDNHLWSVVTSYGASKDITVKDMIKSDKVSYLKGEHISHNYYVPLTEAQFYKKELLIDPYFMGLLLGDGSLSGTGSVELSLGKDKEHVLDNLVLPEGVSFHKSWVDSKNYFRVKFVGVNSEYGSIMRYLLSEYNLLGVKSDTKFIPSDYLLSDIEDRKKLLKGLLDTDGYINNRNLFEFSSVSEQLKDGFQELCNSLSIPISTSKLIRKENSSYSDTPIYRILQRKGFKYGEQIVAIVPTGVYTDMMCIKVSGSDSLYITDNYIPTHNTTTATVIAQSIFEGGLSLIDKGSSSVEIKKGIDKASEDVVLKLKEMSEAVTSDNLKHVATISANGDEELGEMISKAFNKIGKHGTVLSTISDTSETYVEVREGTVLDRGYTSRVFRTDVQRDLCKLENPFVLLHRGKIEKGDKIVKLFDAVFQKPEGRLLIITDDIDPFVHSVIAQNIDSGAIRNKICVVSLPQILKIQLDLLNDLAVLTGATIVSAEKGTKIEASVLGKIKSCVVSEKDTVIVGDTNNLTELVKSIKDKIEITKNKFDKEELQERLSRITGGVATIYIGAKSDSELAEKSDRVEDSINATRSALEEGIVSGGGVALMNICNALKGNNSDKKPAFKDGYNLLLDSCLQPFLQILINAGMVNPYTDLKEGEGIDVKTGEKVMMLDYGIIDPTKVTRCAVENAASVASTFLTTEAVVYRNQ